MDKFDQFRDEVEESEVPEKLRDLIPFAYKWGIGDDVARGEVAEDASDTEKREFQDALRGRTAQVTTWLDSFPANAVHPGAFSNFTYMLEALDEMDLWPDS
jgi:hypothetical protein